MLFVIATTAVYSQRSQTEAVYLKNGSVIRGVVVEQKPNESIKIQTQDGSIFHYQMAEIEKITKENRANSNSVFIQDPKEAYSSGMRKIIDIGYTGGFIESVELHGVYGGQVNPYMFIGTGTGFHYYHDVDALSIPLFFEFRANYYYNPMIPFVGMRGGYVVNISGDIGSGLYLYPHIGIKTMLSNDSTIGLSVGLTIKQFKTDYYNTKEDGFSIKLGYEF